MNTQNTCNDAVAKKAVIGLGNPGQKFLFNRHNIGFMVVDYLALQFQGTWREQDNILYTTIEIENNKILIVKPQSFMNSSGIAIPWLAKKNIKLAEILVVHDELEHPFGKVSYRCGGSARGHNGLRSLIAQSGPDFCRIRCGIGRPEKKEDVAHYVLSDFTEGSADVELMARKAAEMVVQLVK